MAGEFGSPYREPCGGWPEAQRWSMPSHTISAHKTIAKWNNATTIDSNPPAEKLANGSAYPGCAGAIPDCDTEDCGTWRSYLQDAPAGVTACTTPDTTHATVDHNCFVKSESETIDYSACKKVGFKNVQAFKCWHGTFGPKSDWWQGAATMKGNCDDVTTRAKCDPLDTTKYLKLAITASTSQTDDVDVTTTGSAASSSEVGRNTGVITGSLTSSGTLGGTAKALINSWGTANRAAAAAYYCDRVANHFFTRDPSYEYTTWSTSAGGNPSITYTYEAEGVSIEEVMSINLDTGAFSQVYDYVAGSTEIHAETTIAFTDTTVAYDYVFSNSAPDLGYLGAKEEHVAAAYSEPYTAANCWADVKDLLDTWDMSDDTEYPWRTDAWTTIAPLVLRDEVSPAVAPGVITSESYTDPNNGNYAGGIVGAPNPAGYDSHFCWQHYTHKCCKDESLNPQWYIYSQGAWSNNWREGITDRTDGVVPRAATQWVENRNSICGMDHDELRGGAWATHVPTHGIYAQKWAEVLLSWPSLNFNRPCGIDRGELDATNSECVGNIVDGDVTLEGSVGIQSNDYCLYNGHIYKVTRIDDNEFTLGTALCAAPAWMNFSAGDQELPADMLCKLRWFSAKPMCQSANVVTAVDNEDGTVTITTEKDVYLFGLSAETLDFTDVAGLSTGVAVHSVTSLTEFKVSGSLSGEYVSGGKVAPAGYDATNDKWNDDNPKRDYILREWDEAGTLTETADCLFPKPCCPSVLACIPLDSPESWLSGQAKTCELAQPTADECNGSLIATDFLQAVPDPFWQAPPPPCSGDEAWTEDSTYTCPDDVPGEGGFKYYPGRPYIEALLTVPTGATLQSGITLHTPASGLPATSGHDCDGATHEPRELRGPWSNWISLRSDNESDSACRFKDNYAWQRKL